MVTEAIGWASAAVFLATISRQVFTQYQSGTFEGVSKWLFVGQVVASTGFVVYSYLLDNWVFVLTNALILVAALFGQAIYLRNKRRAAQANGAESPHAPTASRGYLSAEQRGRHE